MLKTLFAPLQEFKRAAGLAALFAALEVVMEVLLPLVMALLIDRGISAGQMDQVVRYGVLMLVLAFLSLACGVGGQPGTPPGPRRGMPATCGRVSSPRSRPSPSPTSTSSAPPAWSHG